jgi:hypothetical protein
MIKQYILILLLTYIEYFILWFFLEYKHRIIWDNIKFWLKYPPFICLFFYLIDDFFIGTMIYITFSFPYLLIVYCIRNINRDFFDSNRILVSASLRYYSNKKK